MFENSCRVLFLVRDYVGSGATGVNAGCWGAMYALRCRLRCLYWAGVTLLIIVFRETLK